MRGQGKAVPSRAGRTGLGMAESPSQNLALNCDCVRSMRIGPTGISPHQSDRAHGRE